MSLKIITNKIMWLGHVAIKLQLFSFLGASFIEHMFHKYCLVFDLWNRWKNLLLIKKNMRKKNQIPKYYAPSPKETIKKIWDWLIINFQTQ